MDCTKSKKTRAECKYGTLKSVMYYLQSDAEVQTCLLVSLVTPRVLYSSEVVNVSPGLVRATATVGCQEHSLSAVRVVPGQQEGIHLENGGRATHSYSARVMLAGLTHYWYVQGF